MRLTRETVFDYKTHKENFFNYLEVILFKDGHIEYAVPSHQLKLIDIYCKEKNITEDKVWDLIPPQDLPIDWLLNELGCVSVWYEFIMRPDLITEEQKESLKRLVDEGLMQKDYGQLIVCKNIMGYLTRKVGYK